MDNCSECDLLKRLDHSIPLEVLEKKEGISRTSEINTDGKEFFIEDTENYVLLTRCCNPNSNSACYVKYETNGNGLYNPVKANKDPRL